MAFDRDVDKPVVSCPIAGATKPKHLLDAVAALDLTLTDSEIIELEERYTRRTTTGGDTPCDDA